MYRFPSDNTNTIADPKNVVNINAASNGKKTENQSFNNIKQDHSPGIYFDIDKSFPEEACKIVAHISDNNIAKAIADKCGCEYFHYRGETTYTFFHKKASKLDAIKHMADYLDISLKDICAFGDDINDIEMIEHCGYGVAMANALDIVKEKADFVTLSNEENGVAKVLDEF